MAEEDVRKMFERLDPDAKAELLDIAERALVEEFGEADPMPEDIEDTAIGLLQEVLIQTLPTDDMVQQVMEDEYKRHYDTETSSLSGQNYAEARTAAIKRIEELSRVSWAVSSEADEEEE
jgi:hypothetical protein